MMIFISPRRCTIPRFSVDVHLFADSLLRSRDTYCALFFPLFNPKFRALGIVPAPLTPRRGRGSFQGVAVIAFINLVPYALHQLIPTGYTHPLGDVWT